MRRARSWPWTALPCLPVLPTTPARMTHDYAQRHPEPVRRARRGHQPGDRPALPAAPPPGVPALPQAHRCRRARRPRPAPGVRQLCHAQDPGHRRRLLRHPRLHLHFRSAGSSWINLAKRWFAELTDRKLRRSAHRHVTELEAGIRKWVIEWNRTRNRSCGPRPPIRSLRNLAACCRRVDGSAR
jgi:transposase